MWALYILLLTGAVIFHVMYNGDLSFVLLAFIIVLPLFLLVTSILTAKAMHVAAHIEQPSAVHGKSAALRITVRNRSPFPAARFRLDVKCRTALISGRVSTEKYRLQSPIGARASESFSVNISSEHCGKVSITVKNICVIDFMGMFPIPIKSGTEGNILFLPMIYPIRGELENGYTDAPESGTFSPAKSGDDPSEIFSLREYHDGDNLNRIHWKLSSRSEAFIVKELSRPVGCSTLIAVDFFGCGDCIYADKVLDAAFSVSAFLNENGVAHRIAWACSDYTVSYAEITDENKLCAEMNSLCSDINTLCTESTFAYALGIADSGIVSRGGFSRVIAVTGKLNRYREEELEQLCGGARLTIICTGEAEESRPEDEKMRTAEVIFADAEKLSESGFTVF